MKTRAAIRYAADKPLKITTVDLDGPKAGELLVDIQATGICHNDEFTRSGDLAQDQSVYRDSRDDGQGRDARWLRPFLDLRKRK